MRAVVLGSAASVPLFPSVTPIKPEGDFTATLDELEFVNAFGT